MPPVAIPIATFDTGITVTPFGVVMALPIAVSISVKLLIESIDALIMSLILFSDIYFLLQFV
jgi:hypothetical protein